MFVSIFVFDTVTLIPDISVKNLNHPGLYTGSVIPEGQTN